MSRSTDSGLDTWGDFLSRKFFILFWWETDKHRLCQKLSKRLSSFWLSLCFPSSPQRIWILTASFECPTRLTECFFFHLLITSGTSLIKIEHNTVHHHHSKRTKSIGWCLEHQAWFGDKSTLCLQSFKVYTIQLQIQQNQEGDQKESFCWSCKVPSTEDRPDVIFFMSLLLFKKSLAHC